MLKFTHSRTYPKGEHLFTVNRCSPVSFRALETTLCHEEGEGHAIAGGDRDPQTAGEHDAVSVRDGGEVRPDRGQRGGAGDADDGREGGEGGGHGRAVGWRVGGVASGLAEGGVGEDGQGGGDVPAIARGGGLGCLGSGLMLVETTAEVGEVLSEGEGIPIGLYGGGVGHGVGHVGWVGLGERVSGCGWLL